MPVSENVQKVIDLLSSNEEFTGESVFFYPSSPEYEAVVLIRGAHRNLHPEVVVIPTKLSQIGPLASALYASSLDFSTRNGGAGSASARHVLISLSNLKSMNLDRSTETFTVQAGAIWNNVNAYLAAEAPDWSIVGPRSSFTGVVGVTLIGGLSYLGGEHGLVSDPKNLLDVQIALRDGRLIWASEEPELLWTMRAGRCAFGIVTALKLRARKTKTQSVYSAWMLFPMEQVADLSRAIAKHLNSNTDPWLNVTTYVLSPNGLWLKHPGGMALMLFDQHGAEHARSEAGFKWAFDLGGAEMGGEMSLHEVNNKLTDPGHGKWAHHDVAGLLDYPVDENLVVRAKDWYYSVIAADPALEEGSFCLVEFQGPGVFGSTQPHETAWPHGTPKHVLQLGVGYAPENKHLKELALKKLGEGFQTIPSKPLGKGDFLPTFYEPSVMDFKEMYGPHYAKLEAVADQYDPQRRFRSLFNQDPNFTWATVKG